MKVIGSRVLFQKPSNKAVEFPEGVQAELAAKLLEKVHYAIFPLPFELEDDLLDPSYVAQLIEECIDEDLRKQLLNTEFGMGYLIGMVFGIYYANQQFAEAEEDEEEDFI